MVTVRGMTPEDYPAVHALDAATQAEYRAEAWDAMTPEQQKRYLWFHPDHLSIGAKDLLFVAEEGGTVVGFLLAYRSPLRPHAVVDGVAVASTHRRQGVGVALYEELRRRCEALGIEEVCAGINPDNAASQRLHEAAGFRLVSWIDARFEMHQ